MANCIHGYPSVIYRGCLFQCTVECRVLQDGIWWFAVFWSTNCSKCERKEEVRKHTRALPHTSSRQLALYGGLAHTLNYWEMCFFGHPYKIMLHELKPQDHNWYATFCNGFYTSVIVLQKYWTKYTFLMTLGFIYRAILMSKTFAFGNPHKFQVILLHLQKVSVWCPMSQFKIIVPFFFNHNGNS